MEQAIIYSHSKDQIKITGSKPPGLQDENYSRSIKGEVLTWYVRISILVSVKAGGLGSNRGLDPAKSSNLISVYTLLQWCMKISPVSSVGRVSDFTVHNRMMACFSPSCNCQSLG